MHKIIDPCIHRDRPVTAFCCKTKSNGALRICTVFFAAGGAIYAYDSDPTINGYVRLESNKADFGGKASFHQVVLIRAFISRPE